MKGPIRLKDIKLLSSNREKRRKQVAGLCCLGLFALFTLLIFWFAGRPMVQFVSQPEAFRQWMQQQGVWGKLAFIGMMAFQILVAVIPGEPLEIGAGYAFGVWEGTLLCLLGALLGSVILFLLVRRLGLPFVTLFVPEEKLSSLKFLRDTKRLNLALYLLFLIPGTPKDLMTFAVGLTPMKLSFWCFLTMTARIPSVITSTIGGDALSQQDYGFALWVFAATAVLALAGILCYRFVSKREKKEKQPSSQICLLSKERAA